MRRSLIWLAIAVVSVVSCKPVEQPGLAPLPPAGVPTELVPTLPGVPPVTSTVAPTLVPGATVALKSGITFTVTLGPTCPGPQREEEVCTAPYEGAFVVTHSDGREAARFTTDVHGRAVVDLPPGSYIVSIKPGTGRSQPRGGPVDVTVAAGQYVEISLALDTGMR
jgi:hypothetical protein